MKKRTATIIQEMKVWYIDPADPQCLTTWFDPPKLPADLVEPISVDHGRTTSELEAAMRRKPGFEAISQMEYEAKHYTGLTPKLQERWKQLSQFYLEQDHPVSLDDWKFLAIYLANDFVPGIRLKYFRNEDDIAHDQMTLDLVAHVADIRTKMQGKNPRAPKVSETAALREIYSERPWSKKILGDKPKTIGAFQADFSRKWKVSYESIQRGRPDLPSLKAMGLKPVKAKP